MHRLHLDRTIRSSRATGNMVHDAHIAALLIEHGVTEVLTTDRDFSRFPRSAHARPPYLLIVILFIIVIIFVAIVAIVVIVLIRDLLR